MRALRDIDATMIPSLIPDNIASTALRGDGQRALLSSPDTRQDRPLRSRSIAAGRQHLVRDIYLRQA
jgi:hypothetical protein